MTGKLSVPDYLFWSKWDAWTFKEAALLLHGFEPWDFKPVNFNAETPPDVPELSEVYKTFLLLKKASWSGLGTIHKNSVHPFSVQAMVRHKDLPIPEKLHEYLEVRRKREQANTHLHAAASNEIEASLLEESKSKEPSAYQRERRNLLKTIGLLVLLLEDGKEHSTKIKRNGHVIASQMRERILEKAARLNIDVEGLKSVNRKFTEALILINQESNLKIIEE